MRTFRGLRFAATLFVQVVLLVSVPALASAATLVITPAAGTYPSGQTFTVSVLVSTDVSVNAVSGTLQFSRDILQVVSVSKSGSIVGFWVQEPSYSNTTGIVQFEGIIPNPGYTGTNGKTISVVFRAVRAGTVNVSMRDGQVLANDGRGTNVLQGSGNASFLVSESVIGPSSVPPAAPQPRGAPAGTSPEEEALPETSSTPEEPASVIPVPPEPTFYVLDQQSVILFFAIVLAFLLGMLCFRLLAGTPHRARGIRQVLLDADEEVHSAFMALRQRINQAIDDFKRESLHRELTEAEERFVHDMTGAIQETQKTVEKDIREAGK